jgi:hypothetical protein
MKIAVPGTINQISKKIAGACKSFQPTIGKTLESVKSSSTTQTVLNRLKDDREFFIEAGVPWITKESWTPYVLTRGVHDSVVTGIWCTGLSHVGSAAKGIKPAVKGISAAAGAGFNYVRNLSFEKLADDSGNGLNAIVTSGVETGKKYVFNPLVEIVSEKVREGFNNAAIELTNSAGNLINEHAPLINKSARLGAHSRNNLIKNLGRLFS